MKQDFVGLSALVSEVKQVLEEHFVLHRWVIAEISEMNTNRSGHCYLELIEKDKSTDRIIAKSRATIWAFAFRMLKPYFESATGESLRPGLKVLLKVSVEFHDVYGFSLNVQDIDPQYTLGDMAQKRAKIIKQLEEDGVIEMNKALELPIAPQKIAVITSETAAGYGDFKDQLENNKYKFDFNLSLFPAIMQGDKAPESIINAFDTLFEHDDSFDAVILIRGGGSKSDLSCFDDYDLAYYITQFPIPVITGIGHDRDDSVSDIVAHTKLKTPTAVAEFLINSLLEVNEQLAMAVDNLNSLSHYYFEKRQNQQLMLSNKLVHGTKELLMEHSNFLDQANLKVSSGVKQFIQSKTHRLDSGIARLRAVTHTSLQSQENLMAMRSTRIVKWVSNLFSRQDRKLSFFESKVEVLKPENVMKRGFAIVKKNNELIKTADQLTSEDHIEVQLYKGRISAGVKEVLDTDLKASD